jgi:hypothetical protein
MFRVKENVGTPQAFHDFIPRDKAVTFLNQQDEQLHRQFFQFKSATGTDEFESLAIEFEFIEFDGTGRQAGPLSGSKV